MKAQPCLSHHFVTDRNGERISRRCVYCGRGPISRAVGALLSRIRPSDSQTAAEAQNRAEWDRLNSAIVEGVDSEPTSETPAA